MSSTLWALCSQTVGFLPQVVMDWGADITPTVQTHKGGNIETNTRTEDT